MDRFTYQADDENATQLLGAALAEILPDGTTVALCGTLGAGKTRLVQAIAEASGVPRREVVSPTFVLIQEHRGRRPIYHLDAYRLRDEDEFLQLGPEEYFESSGLTLIEWGDRVERCLPRQRIEIHAEVTGHESRRFEVVDLAGQYQTVIDQLRRRFPPGKAEIRKQAEANRRQQPDKERLSQAICERFASLPEYAAARTVMMYVDVRNEVRTRPFLPAALAQGKRMVVPYCVDGELELFPLESLDELAVASFGLLEPKPELRLLPQKRVEPEELDLVMVPGVAFDRQGGRIGHGKGYYDRLLRRVRPDAPLIGIAFECQIFAEIPMLPHDVRMDKVITERGVYLGRARPALNGSP
jgi:5-formyltetrahydrofolate cyclo-ligase